jgi:hypothetical protein
MTNQNFAQAVNATLVFDDIRNQITLQTGCDIKTRKTFAPDCWLVGAAVKTYYCGE